MVETLVQNGIYFELPDEFREVLANFHIYAKPCSTTFLGSRESIGIVLRNHYFDNLYRTIVVGDYTCRTYAKYVGIPRICIVDRKTHRYLDIDSSDLESLFESRTSCVNPRGTISTDCLKAIYRSFRSGLRTILIVDGEEDLLALAAMLVVIDGIVVYGIPGKGVALVDVECAKIRALNIFSQFKSVKSGMR